MQGSPHERPGPGRTGAQERRARRQAQQRAARRRVLALIAVIALAIAVIAIAAGGGSGGAGTRGAGAKATASKGPAPHHPGRPDGGTGTPASGPPGNHPVPILMYHVIASPPAGAPFPGLYVTPSQFAAQMQALRQAGWHAVTMDQMRAHWLHGAPLPAGKPIVVSFDNGYQSQYTQALPILRRLGWVGVENIQLTGLPPSQGGLGEGEVRGLIAAGWELDTQGMSHADLIALGPEALHYQVVVARETLRRRYHVPVNWFCYPSGHYDATVIAALKSTGYVGSTTVVPGWAHRSDDPYRLHRLRVLGGTSPAELLRLIVDTREDPPAPASYSGG